MKALKSHSHQRPPIGDRLSLCVDKVGGKRAMAAATLISEAQLFRYLSGESDMPSDKLMAVAHAAQVDAGWLLTGTGSIEGFKVDPQPSFRAELMIQVAQTFEELLVESNRTFTPRQKALASTLIYEALRFEEARLNHEVSVDKRMTPYYPDFLAPLRSDSRMEDYMSTMNALEHGKDVSVQSIKQFDALVKMGLTSAYEGAMGEIYFDKMGTSLLPEASKTLLGLVEKASSLTGKTKMDWLDAGCGNGRHLAFLVQHCPHLALLGFDLSKLALSLCEKQVRSGKLPIGIVQEADLRNMPYPNDSVDVVYCRAGLHLLPYLPEHMVGANQFMQEVNRVLRPNGVAIILTPQGSGRDYVNFIQYYTPQCLLKLVEAAKMKVVSLEEAPTNETGGTAGKDYSQKVNNGLQLILQKQV